MKLTTEGGAVEMKLTTEGGAVEMKLTRGRGCRTEADNYHWRELPQVSFLSRQQELKPTTEGGAVVLKLTTEGRAVILKLTTEGGAVIQKQTTTKLKSHMSSYRKIGSTVIRTSYTTLTAGSKGWGLVWGAGGWGGGRKVLVTARFHLSSSQSS